MAARSGPSGEPPATCRHHHDFITCRDDAARNPRPLLESSRSDEQSPCGRVARSRPGRSVAQAFDDGVKRALATRDDFGLVRYERLAGDAAAMAVQTPDHYFPFLYALGASDSTSEKAVSVFEGFQSGTLSMRCVQFGA